MSPHDWFILIAAAAFLLIGIAISPLAWLAIRQQKTQHQESTDRRLEGLEARVTQLETQAVRPLARADEGRSDGGNDRGVSKAVPRHANTPTLIAVPKLSPALPDSDTNLQSLADRYADIWQLADSGASPDAIARATGQPIGQVELILGLRRQRPTAIHAIKAHPPHG